MRPEGGIIMLRFFGRGSAFADTQNCAFFTAGSELVLLDCPMSAFHRLRKLQFPQTQITVVVTHTHGDHIGGIPMLIALSQFVWKKPVTVIAPDQTVADDLKFFIERLDGGDPDAYTLLTADAAEREWLCGAVPVRHVPGLAGRCYGYRLRIAGQDVIYTGDTAELEPFLPYLHRGAYLYTECAAHDTGVHLFIDELLPKLRELKAGGVKIYLMHLDDEKVIREKIKGSGIRFAKLFRSGRVEPAANS